MEQHLGDIVGKSRFAAVATAGNGRIRAYSMRPTPLDTLSFHTNCEFITRLAPRAFPLHVSVHEVGPVDGQPASYVELHSHETPEVNILISTQEKLTYLYRSNEEEFILEAPACVWIPPGVPHAAQAVSGAGVFVCLILAEEYQALRG